jgi:hypothetical protein
MADKEFAGKFCKYMPVSSFPEKKGFALQASVSQDQKGRTRLFIEMAPQVKPKPPEGSTESPFDWEQKKFISLDDGEMADILACFHGYLKKVTIYHKFPVDAPPEKQKVTILNVEEGEYNKVVNWRFALSQKIGGTTVDNTENFQVYIQPGEAEVLKIFITKALEKFYRL